MAMTPNQSVIWYQKRFTPNNRNMNRFSDAIPTSDPFGPIGFTSTFAATTVKAANSKNKAPVKINFFLLFVLRVYPLFSVYCFCRLQLYYCQLSSKRARNQSSQWEKALDTFRITGFFSVLQSISYYFF